MTTLNIELATPFIHPNGDRRETLLDRLETAYSAVNDAMDALRYCAPNGRNAYPVAGLMERLEAQHRQRQECLSAVIDSIEAEVSSLSGS